MISMTLEQAARAVNGVVIGAPGGASGPSKVEFSDIATDTRKSMVGKLFIALKGENFNAHEFIDQAEEQGAVACMVDEDIETTLPILRVSNTISAMGLLAKYVREQLNCPCIGITGSSGKTTVKEMIASILAMKGRVLATAGNFNNAIGVPLTLFRLTPEDQYAVVEMGASQVGDIEETAQLVNPDVAMITNVSAAHLQGLGTIEGVANVKGEILDYLKLQGTAVLEQDSPWLARWMNQLSASQQLRTFSIGNPAADYYASDIRLSELGMAQFVAHTPVGEIEISLPVAGMHNVSNALAAMAATVAVGASLKECQLGLASVAAVKGRLQILNGVHGCRIIDDSYNANPASLFAAMDLLKDFSGKRMLVLGDMGELGDKSESAHRDAGRQARAMGLDGLYATGPLSRFAVEGFGAGAEHFETKAELAEALTDMLKASEKDTVQWNLLIKGSRSAEMDELVVNLHGKGSTKQEKKGTR